MPDVTLNGYYVHAYFLSFHSHFNILVTKKKKVDVAEYSQQDLNHTAGSANYRHDDVTARQASPLDGARLSVNGTF